MSSEAINNYDNLDTLSLDSQLLLLKKLLPAINRSKGIVVRNAINASIKKAFTSEQIEVEVDDYQGEHTEHYDREVCYFTLKFEGKKSLLIGLRIHYKECDAFVGVEIGKFEVEGCDSDICELSVSEFGELFVKNREYFNDYFPEEWQDSKRANLITMTLMHTTMKLDIEFIN